MQGSMDSEKTGDWDRWRDRHKWFRFFIGCRELKIKHVLTRGAMDKDRYYNLILRQKIKYRQKIRYIFYTYYIFYVKTIVACARPDMLSPACVAWNGWERWERHNITSKLQNSWIISIRFFNVNFCCFHRSHPSHATQAGFQRFVKRCINRSARRPRAVAIIAGHWMEPSTTMNETGWHWKDAQKIIAFVYKFFMA